MIKLDSQRTNELGYNVSTDCKLYRRQGGEVGKIRIIKNLNSVKLLLL